MLTLKYSAVKRGDTIVEVMFALTIFTLVAVMSIAMMNSGVRQAENALENVTVRNEINAQAEALRFIHSSYISEGTLPESGAGCGTTEKCQQYKALWETIVGNALTPDQAQTGGLLDLGTTVYSAGASATSNAIGCARIYDNSGGNNMLYNNKAFILNTRDLSSMNGSQVDVEVSYISAQQYPQAFVPAELNARVVYTTAPIFQAIREIPGFNFKVDTLSNSTLQLTDGVDERLYNRVGEAEGIWAFAVKSDNSMQPSYYDFYIESCWYGPNTTAPTTIDTVIRLYNPENI